MSRRGAPLPPHARLLLGVVALQFVGTGLVLPFHVLYLNELRGFDLTTVGLLVAIPPTVALVLIGPAGTLVDRKGPRRLMMLDLALFAFSSVLLAAADSLWFTAAALLGNGIAQGIAWPAAQTMVAETVPTGQQARFFGINFTLLNAGIGVGGIIGNLIVDADDLRTLQTIFVIDAVAYLPCLVVLLGPLRAVGAPRPSGVRTAAPAIGYRSLLRQPVVASIFVLGFLTSFVGASQFRAGLPAFARSVADLSTHTLGLIFTLDTVVIIVAQMAVIRRLDGHRRTRGLASLGLVWAVAWLVMAMAGAAAGTRIAIVLALGFAVVFGFGETLRPIMPALVNDLAPPHVRGRYHAINAAGFQLAGVVSPPVAGFLIGHGLASVYIAAMVLVALLLSAFAVWFAEPRLPLHANGLRVQQSAAEHHTHTPSLWVDARSRCPSGAEWSSERGDLQPRSSDKSDWRCLTPRPRFRQS